MRLMVRFEPKAPGDEEKARQATEYANWVLMNDNPGFEVFQTWFKDALLQKNGIVKVWWNDETDVIKESYKDLTEEELALLLSDGQMEIVSQEQNQVGEVPTMVPDAMGMPVQTMQPIFSLLRSSRLAIASLTIVVDLLGMPLGLPGPASPSPIFGVSLTLSMSESLMVVRFKCCNYTTII